MKSRLAALLVCVALGSEAGYRQALPGYRYEFPRDHFNHEEFQTEWWYYTGNLRASDGRKFGFELTFFRHAVQREAGASVWDVRDIWLAHLALSDIDGGRFMHAERTNRAGAGLAGASLTERRVWNGNWEARWTGEREQRLVAIDERFRFELALKSVKAPVVHGVAGVSQKAAGAGRASHYVSLTRLEASGTVTVDGKALRVEGLAWMDHEFFTHQLAPEQTGWDWFSLQFDDGTELMLFRLRRKDGSADPYSAGTFVDARGRAVHLSRDQFTVTPGKTWKKYPVEWTVRAPSVNVDVKVATRLQGQELAGGGNVYWEGAMEVSGSRKGVGYLEMTGYEGPVKMGQ